ncbi:hypothetical protein [Amycolatopsis taiwanensis]|uniref:hypothetical protein n=1 Tax=Amycolatopsis taiwanensis TaxID=342230 RepID=UPI0012EC14FA
MTISAEGPRSRKEYAITDAGRAELRRWLLEPPNPKARRDDLPLRVAFLGAVEPEEGRQILANTRDMARERHKELRKLQRSINWGDDAGSGCPPRRSALRGHRRSRPATRRRRRVR